MILALFAVAPVVCSCLLSLVYTLYLFMAYEESGVHHAQEYENRFWTIFALLFSTALFFAQDSPLAFGRYNPSLGFFGVLLSSYVMHLYDRYMHRVALSRQTKLRRSVSLTRAMGEQDATGEERLTKINKCLRDIDQLLIPSTINNFLNRRFVLKKEREILSIFLECDAVTLNYLICHVKLALLVYKIKDHGFGGQHRTELIQLVAVERLPALTVMARVIVLHSLQILKLRANPRAEHWVRNIFLNTHGDDLSEIKTLTDAKGDYYCMSKLLYDDIRSEAVRQDILNHIRREGAMQLSRREMGMGTKRGVRRYHMVAWRKILSDVDDTLLSSGGLYPAGIDKRYSRKVVYPGVLAFYRELDLGITGPDDWPEHRVGNLVFLSARPHVYKDMSEKSNFAKFEKLRIVGDDGRRGMHTVPSLLAGDLASGSQYIATNDFEPLARKKFENFKRYVSIYPEYHHIFVCDNGQGDVSAGEMMFDNFPYEFQTMYVHIVQDIQRTYGYAPQRWKEKEFSPRFFKTYPEAALHAASQNPPLIRLSGLQRVCSDSVKDFGAIPSKQWQSEKQKAGRRAELNQSIWSANKYLEANEYGAVDLIKAERHWKDGETVKTPYGNGIIRGFTPEFDRYDVELDWRPLDVQVNEHVQNLKEETARPKAAQEKRTAAPLETVVEADEVTDDEQDDLVKLGSTRRPSSPFMGKSPPRNNSKLLESTEKSEPVCPAIGPNESKRATSSHDSKVAASSMSDSSSVSSISSDESNQGQKSGQSDRGLKVTASISGRSISKFIPPSLPKVNKRTNPLFSFWVTTPVPKATEGEKCTTPYGPATVVEHRIEQKIIVVDMIGWTARAYLNEDDVNVVKEIKESLLSSFFRRQSSMGDPAPPKPLLFPYVQGTIVQTPYGEAKVIVPLTPPEDRSKAKKDDSDEIICLSITSWKLANNAHPKVYCTVKACQAWREAKGKEPKSSPNDGLLSAFGTLVQSINREIFAGRLGTYKPKEEEQAAPKFKQYYCDSAAIATAFGSGRVINFRETDGFYRISLSSWTLANGEHPTAWLRGVDIRYQIAKGCQEGYPVLTTFGVSGILESVQPTTGVHIVSAPSARMVLYLQPGAIVRPLKAAVGEDALTAFGEGTIERYDLEHDTYVIKLNGWGAKLYAKAENFDRAVNSMRDRDGSSGMDWLLQFFFSSSSDSKKDGRRSRSNSVVSGTSASLRSQGARSNLT
jgi:hypothetical protein